MPDNPTATAQVIQVIKTTRTVGAGTPDNLLRIRTEYWSLDGKLLAYNDPEEKKVNPVGSSPR